MNVSIIFFVIFILSLTVVVPVQVLSKLPPPERLSFSVPIASNNIERPSALYLNVFAQEPRQSIEDYLKEYSDASDKKLEKLLSSI